MAPRSLRFPKLDDFTEEEACAIERLVYQAY